jgi:hypothetical protein
MRHSCVEFGTQLTSSISANFLKHEMTFTIKTFWGGKNKIPSVFQMCFALMSWPGAIP